MSLSQRLSARTMVLIACATLAGCVIEPVDAIYAPTDGPLKLWGFAMEPSAAVSLEAQNSSNGWELITSSTTAPRITYTGSRSGYYWEMSVGIPQLPARFKVAGKVRLRAKAGTWVMSTRSDSEQRQRVENSSPLVELWNAYLSPSSNGGVITIWL